MPSCAVHIELARRVLTAWGDRADRAPFPIGDPACRGAFLLGSLAPDIGYFPGNDSLLADLAHCVRPAQLARSMVRTAETDRDRALAWGWVTHVLGDIWIHPLINEAVGERLQGVRRPGVTYAADPVSHIRVELGLDAFLPVRCGWPEATFDASLALGPQTFAAMERAYGETYGLAVPRVRLRLAGRVLTMLVPMMLAGGRVRSGRHVRGGVGPLIRGVSGLARRVRPGSRLEAFTNPVSPPDWLIDEAGAVVDAFPEQFQALYQADLVNLPDANLDTGEVEGDPPSYPITIAALAELASRARLAGPLPRPLTRVEEIRSR